MEAIGLRYGFDLNTAVEDIPDEGINTILYGSTDGYKVQKEFMGVTSTYTLNFEGVVNFILNQAQESPSKKYTEMGRRFPQQNPLPGMRWRTTKKRNHSISKLTVKILLNMRRWICSSFPMPLTDWKIRSTKGRRDIGKEIIRELQSRLKFLLDVGLDYLNLNRSAKTLSGGESQRIRLATQIGSQLVGVLYILDEPSIGLHQRDNQRLIDSLKQLRDIGNSVIVVEHDKDMILSADHVIDIGPGAGVNGGKIVAQGSPNQMHQCDTLTCAYLSGKKGN